MTMHKHLIKWISVMKQYLKSLRVLWVVIAASGSLVACALRDGHDMYTKHCDDETDCELNCAGGESNDDGSCKGNIVRIVDIDESNGTTMTTFECDGSGAQCQTLTKKVCSGGSEATQILANTETCDDSRVHELTTRENLYQISFKTGACPSGYDSRKVHDGYECFTLKCSGKNTSFLADRFNCGGCGEACEAGQTCLNGRCGAVCSKDNETLCHGSCIIVGEKNVISCKKEAYDPLECEKGYGNLDSEVGNGCEAVLDTVHVKDYQRTENGVELMCVEGFADANDSRSDGCEVDCETLPNVGACQKENGKNTLTCKEGYRDCDGKFSNGCEADLQNSNFHCGGCNTACPAGEDPYRLVAQCREGSCEITCKNHYGLNASNQCEFKPDVSCCGSDEDSCFTCKTEIKGFKTGACIQTNGNYACSVSECLDGYILSDGRCIPMDCEGGCDSSSTNRCDEDRNLCVCGENTSSCFGTTPYCIGNGTTADCGECRQGKADNDCEELKESGGVKAVTCNANSECEIESCEDDYYRSQSEEGKPYRECKPYNDSYCYDGQNCEANAQVCDSNQEKCIECSDDVHCNAQKVLEKHHATTMTCDLSTYECKVQAGGCAEGYAFWGDQCYEIVKYEGTDTKIGKVLKGATKDGQQVVYSCLNGYLPNNDRTACDQPCVSNDRQYFGGYATCQMFDFEKKGVTKDGENYSYECFMYDQNPNGVKNGEGTIRLSWSKLGCNKICCENNECKNNVCAPQVEVRNPNLQCAIVKNNKVGNYSHADTLNNKDGRYACVCGDTACSPGQECTNVDGKYTCK